MTRTFIALGGNLGPVESNFQKAESLINQLPDSEVLKVSSIYSSKPVGNSAGHLFKNAVLELQTTLEPAKLLKSLQSIEDSFHRDRSVRWGPRPVDLDIILYGNQIISSTDLIIPHPACWYRQFVVVPMAEIAPEVVHPIKKVSFDFLKNHFASKSLVISLVGGKSEQRIQYQQELKSKYPEVQIDEWIENNTLLLEAAVLIFWLGDEENGNVSFEELPLLARLDFSEVQEDTLERMIEIIESLDCL